MGHLAADFWKPSVDSVRRSWALGTGTMTVCDQDVSRPPATHKHCDHGYVAVYSSFSFANQQTVAARIQSTRVKDTREASAGDLGQHPRVHTHKQQGPTDTDRMCFGGYLVDGTQPKTPLLLDSDTQ